MTDGVAYLFLNSHEVTVQEVFDQGGALEELCLWCHTCDPKGEATTTFDYRYFTDHAVVVGHAYSDMWRTALMRAERHCGFK